MVPVHLTVCAKRQKIVLYLLIIKSYIKKIAMQFQAWKFTKSLLIFSIRLLF